LRGNRRRIEDDFAEALVVTAMKMDAHLPAVQQVALPGTLAIRDDPQIVTVSMVIDGQRDLPAGFATGHGDEHGTAHDDAERGLES
jgi:hypothetical protein